MKASKLLFLSAIFVMLILCTIVFAWKLRFEAIRRAEKTPGRWGERPMDAPGDEPIPEPPEEPVEPLPYFEGLLTAEEIEIIGEKYRPIFEEPRILNAMRDSANVPYVDWARDQQRRLLDAIIFYEGNDGCCGLYPEGHERADLDRMPDFELEEREDVTVMNFLGESAKFVMISHMAWHLFIEANAKTPWRLTDFSDGALIVLFERDHTQPRLGKQYFVVNVHPAECFAIIRGWDREAWDTSETLVRPTVRETIINVMRFIGERTVHYKGGSLISWHPTDSDWPYWMRDRHGEVIMEGGEPVPLDRLPTPREILIERHPHRIRIGEIDWPNASRHHIVPGCWGTSKLVKSLLSSINIPVKLEGDYYRPFGGDSSLCFPDVDGHVYYVHHSDNLCMPHWMQGLLRTARRLEGRERWDDPDFSPLGAHPTGYSILHEDLLPWSSYSFNVEQLEISAEDSDRILEEFGVVFRDMAFCFDQRMLALRAMSAPLTVHLLYERWRELEGMLPRDVLTSNERREFLRILDAELDRRRAARPGVEDPMEMFASELRQLYRLKTGLPWDGDQDGDGFQNYRDRHPYMVDREPDEGAWRTATEF